MFTRVMTRVVLAGLVAVSTLGLSACQSAQKTELMASTKQVEASKTSRSKLTSHRDFKGRVRHRRTSSN